MSQAYEITGKVIFIGESQSFASGFTKREFVVETQEDKYPQKVKLEATKDGCDRLDSYQIGDEITVSFNIRGNEHNGKYYVNLVAWKFDRQSSQRPPQGARSPEFGQRETHQNGAAPPKDVPADDDFDSIPF